MFNITYRTSAVCRQKTAMLENGNLTTSKDVKVKSAGKSELYILRQWNEFKFRVLRFWVGYPFSSGEKCPKILEVDTTEDN